MENCLINKRFLNIFLLILLAGFLILPKSVLADDFDNINSEELSKYLELPEKDANKLMGTLRQVFTTEVVLLWSSGDAPEEKIAVAVTLLKVVKMQALSHLLVDAPIEITWKIINTAVDLVKIYINPAVGLEKLEKLTVEKAIEEGKKQLFQNEIRVTPGAIKFKYYSYKGGEKEIILQYVMIYKPIDIKKGNIEIRFYMPNPIEAPAAEKYGWITSLTVPDLKKDLSPFIVEVSGKVEKDESGNYWWIDEKGRRVTEGPEPTLIHPTVKIAFPPTVPDLGIKPLSLWQKYLLKPIESTIKEVEIVITKVTGKSLGLTDIWEKVKSFISKIPAFAPAALVQAPSVKGEQILDNKTSEPLTIKEAIKEVVEVVEIKPRQSEQKLTTEDIQELLDDISERIDVINQGVVKLTGVEVKPQQTQPQQESQKEMKEELKEKEIEKGEIEPEEKVSFCAINQTAIPQRNKAIINEIAWMGGTNSANDEWIELKNISGAAIDLTGWQILDKGQQIKIFFGKKATIVGILPKEGFYLLERTNDDSAPEAAADFIYTGALSNTNEALYLFDGNCQLQDEVLAEPNWPAGDNTSKRTIERRSDLNWQASADPGGTPRKENSGGYFVYYGGGSSASPTSSSSSPPLVKILISEIQVDSQKGADDEFVELYNPNNQEVSLEKWSIQRAASSGVISKKNFESGNVIPAKGYFLLVNKYASQDLLNLADMSHNSFNLTGGNTIFLVSNQEKISSGEEETVIDKVGYGTAFSPEGGISAPGPISGQSVGRKWDEVAQTYPDTNNNSQDFEIQIPTPKAKNQSPVKDTTPPIAQAGPDQAVEINQPITLDASGSNDNLGITSFKWDIDQDNQWDFDGRAIILKEGFSEIGEHLITLQAADEGGNTATDTLIITVVSPPRILISEIQIASKDNEKEEFVELYNLNETDVDLTNWYIQRKTATASEFSSFAPNTLFSGRKILSKNYFLIARKNSRFESLADIIIDNPLTKNNSLVFKNPNRDIVDEVNWGEIPAGLSYGRIWDGSSQNYLADFEIQIPTPKAKNQKDTTPPETEIISKPPSLTNQTQATFTFQSSKENSSFECEIDRAGWEICQSPKIFSNLSNGEHTFLVRAKDLALNLDSSPAQYIWTVDTFIKSPLLFLADLDSESLFYTNEKTVQAIISNDEEASSWFLSESQTEKPGIDNSAWRTEKPSDFTLSGDDPSASSGQVKTVYIWTKDAAKNISQLGNSASIILDTVLPETNFGEAPANFDNQSQSIFTFSSNEENSTFEYRIDQAADWEICQSPKIFSNLQEGENTFWVRAKDSALNLDSSPAQYIWTVDTIPPVSQVTPLEPSQILLNFLVNWSGTDLGSGILDYALQFKDGLGGEWQNWQESTTELSAEFIGQDKHTYHFRSRAKDKAGNQELWTDEADAFTKIEIPKDVIPPAAIPDLSAETGANPGEIKLTWTAPGDNGNEGQALDYTIKYFSEEITEGKWASSTIVSNPPLPKEAGNLESFVVSGLSSNTIYYFAVKTRDDSQNVSLISNSSFAETPSAVLETSPTPMIFLVEYGESSPPIQELTIKNTGLAGTSWSIFSNSNWLSSAPNSGVLPANNSSQLEISLDISDLKLGDYNASLIVEAPNAKNSPKEISVTLNLKDTTPPIANAGPDQTVETNQPINFDASGSSDNVEIVSFKWDIDSNNGLDWNNPDLTGKNPVFHGYPGVKSYLVTLHVSDASGNIATDGLAVTVVESQPTLEVVINEIAWMGTKAESTDEWIELYNNTANEISLSGWKLVSSDIDGPSITLGENHKIGSKGYFLIEGTDDNTVSDILADWKGGLGNRLGDNPECEVLSLYGRSNNLIDKTACLENGNWFVGQASPNYISMERVRAADFGTGPTNWANNNLITRNGKDAGQNKINGTPKAENSVSRAFTEISYLSLQENLTLTYYGNPYFVKEDIIVPQGKTLTIEPGVVIKFIPRSYCGPRIKVEGILLAAGGAAVAQKIIFTSGKENPLPGDWEFIDFKNTSDSKLENVVIKYGGKLCNNPPVYLQGMVQVEGGKLEVKNSMLEKSLTQGLRIINSSSAIIDAVEFSNIGDQGNGPSAIYVLGGAPTIKNSIFKNNKVGLLIEGGSPGIENNIFEGNEIPIKTNSLLASFSGNSAQNNNLNGILLSSIGFPSGITQIDWKAANLPFIIEGTAEIPLGRTLNIQPGVIIKFKIDGRIYVYGSLRAEGSSAQKIVFTSLKDDYGGDTNNDGNASQPDLSDWDYIWFYSSGSILDNVLIRYGGQGGSLWPPHAGAVALEKDVNLTFKNSLMEKNVYALSFASNVSCDTINGTINQFKTDNVSFENNKYLVYPTNCPPP